MAQHSLMDRAARPAELTLGALFITAAFLKAMDMHLFMGQIFLYGVFTEANALGWISLIATSSELALGIAMIAGLRLRWLVPGLVQAMLVFYTLLILYARPDDCGCFGPVKIPWPVGIAKNVVMMAVGYVAWRPLRHGSDLPEMGAKDHYPIAKLLMALLPAIAMFNYAYGDVFREEVRGNGTVHGLNEDAPPAKEPATGDTSESSTETTVKPPAPTAALPEGPFSGYVIESDYGETYDLGHGEHLVAMLSMTCDHCMASVPTLNTLMYDGSLPPLVAIVFEPEPGSYESFIASTGAEFPMLNLGKNFLEFSKLIDSAPPRLAHVVNGQLATFWDEEIPEAEVIVETLGAQ